MNRRQFLQRSAAAAAGLILAGISSPVSASQVNPSTPQRRQGTTYQEPPSLASLAQAGSLLPVEQRLPVNPLVLTPINHLGSYGGRIRAISGWLGGFWEEAQYGHSPLRWIEDGQAIAPGLCDNWQANADNSQWTFHIREGLKWSDGNPCTVDDIMFWWEDLVLFPGAPENVPDFGRSGASLAVFEKVDETTFRITYSHPSPLTVKFLANWVNGGIGPRFIAPKHYLSQFHPKYNPLVTDFEELKQKMLSRYNPGCPSLNPWICSEYFAGGETGPGRITWNRNPYYYAVDPIGNQLPYIDGIDEQELAGREEQFERVKNGGVDFLVFSDFILDDIARLKAEETNGAYETRLLDSGTGTGQMFYWNHDHPDAKKRGLFRSPKFKQAFSHALNRPLIQQTVYKGFGFQTTGTFSPKAAEFHSGAAGEAKFAGYRDAYVEFNPNLARRLLSEMGLEDVDGDGLREYADGSKLEIFIDLVNGASEECRAVLEIALANWAAVGLNVMVREYPGDALAVWQNGQGDMHANWELSDGPDHLVYAAWLAPLETERWAPLCGKLWEVQGTPDEFSQCGLSPWDRTPPRFCAADPEFAGTPAQTLQQKYRQAVMQADALLRTQAVWEMLDIHKEQVFYIGTVADYPHIVIVSNHLQNVPKKEQMALGGFIKPWILAYPAITNPETYSFSTAADLSLVGPIDAGNNQSPFSPDTVVLRVSVRNGSPVDAISGVQVKFYDGDPGAGGVLIGTAEVGLVQPGEEKKAQLAWTLAGNIEDRTVFAQLQPIEGHTDPNPALNLLSTSLSVYYSDFRHDRDAYSFANHVVGDVPLSEILQFLADFDVPEMFWNPLLPFIGVLLEGNGYCYGISNSSLVYQAHPELKPAEKDTFALSVDEARAKIRTYQWLAAVPSLRIVTGLESYDHNQAYENTLTSIRQGQPVMHGLFQWQDGRFNAGSHAVVAYKIIVVGGQKKVYYYDPNLPLSAFASGGAETYGVFSDQGFSEPLYPTLTPPYVFTRAYPMSMQLSHSDAFSLLWDVIRHMFGSLFETGNLVITTSGAANLVAFDSNGRQTGFPGGSQRQEIPGSQATQLGSSQSLVLPASGPYQFELTQQAASPGQVRPAIVIEPVRLSIFDPIGRQQARQIIFEDIPLSAGAAARLDYQSGQQEVLLQLPGGASRPADVDQVVSPPSSVYLPFVGK